ncbi:hypothetical protein WL1483_2315 [Aeromonas schubertii]|uniref:Uncharacterized protein n=1 Tax=Aeromonas schubertii TaxID=652 RepID=A0A0S2SJ64_9GAMM|nr:hypothetical protein WL1483_2315 [Aeromonas schubertii]
MVDAYPVSYKPFHNQLSKPAFSVSMKALVERAIALRISPLAQDVAQRAFGYWWGCSRFLILTLA